MCHSNDFFPYFINAFCGEVIVFYAVDKDGFGCTMYSFICLYAGAIEGQL